VKQVMTIAGSDSGGGAGIQADLKAFAAMGVYGTSAVTAITAQNTRGVTDVHEIPVPSIRSQIRALFDDFDIAAVKTGMLASAEIVECVAEELERAGPRPLVVDPVMVSASRHELMRGGAVPALKERLIPMATLITPNLHEASVLADREIRTIVDMREAAPLLQELGCAWVLVKGGHAAGDDAVDVLYGLEETDELSTPRIDTRNTHGTGCVFASAVAARLALGETVPVAVGKAKAFITEAIRNGIDVGGGHGPTNPFYFLPEWDTGDTKERGTPRA
jgi:hydroxymethylpyrimidine/phosphomethylpyrimidine kinase